jgi:hypothetical protein
MRSEKQMRRIHAGRYIAGMKDADSFRNRSIVELIGYPMRSSEYTSAILAVQIKLAIATWILASKPEPTAIS